MPTQPDDFEILREELRKQVETVPYEFGPGKFTTTTRLDPIPYLDDPDQIRLLFCGLELYLSKNGTWGWGDTTGG